VLRSDAAKAKPGLKGNLIANAYQKRTVTDRGGKNRESRDQQGMLPAIPFKVVEPESLKSPVLPPKCGWGVIW